MNQDEKYCAVCEKTAPPLELITKKETSLAEVFAGDPIAYYHCKKCGRKYKI